MAVRRESVRIEVDSNMASVMARDAAAVAALRRELDGLNRSSASFRRSATSSPFDRVDRDLGRVRRSAAETSSSINQLTGRLGLAADAALALGPGLIPITAVGAQAIGGLTVALAGVVTIAGSAMAALQGVGDATKAIDDFQADRTADNLAKAREEFAKLGPDAQNFVVKLQEAQPLFREMRDAAAAGFLPGLARSLDDLDRVAPKISRLLEAAGRAGGGIAEDAMDSLAGQRWDEFFLFAEREFPAAAQSLARTMGDLAHGAGEMLMALDPGNDRFLGWLEDVAEDFDNWASSAEGVETIQDFLAYARENGPRVQEMFSSLAGALGAIVEAAAPIGGVTLDALSSVLRVVEGIAESDLATPLLAAAVAMRVYTRAAGLAATAQSRFMASSVMTARGVPTATGMIGSHTPAWLAAQIRAQEARDRAQALRQQRLAAAGRGIGLAAGIGLIASGATDEINKTNTAMMTMVGTAGGPYGAAAGFIVGSLLDMKEAASGAAQEIDAFNAALDSGASLPQLGEAAGRQRDMLEEYVGSVDSFGGAVKTFARDPSGFYDLLDGSADRLKGYADSAADASESTRTLGVTFLRIGDALNGGGNTLKAGDLMMPDLEKAQRIAEQVAPAMSRLGVTLDDIRGMDSGQLADFVNKVAQLTKEADTPASKVKDLTDAIGGVSDVALTAADSADNLRTALDALLSPNMDLTAATDKWTTSLRTLNEDLADNRTIVGDSDAAIQNRAAIQERIVDLTNKLVAQAGKGGKAGSRDALAETLRDGRKELIALGDSLGIEGPKLDNFLRDQGLSWKLVREVIRNNAATARQEVKKVASIYDQLPEVVQTHLTTKGIPTTEAQVDRLVAKYGLTEEQRTALIALKDMASGKVGAIQAAIDSIRGKDVQVTVTQVFRQVGRKFGDLFSADGGTVPKSGQGYSDKYPYMLADGEEVISNRYGQADRHRSLLKAINAGMLADGGTTRRGRGARGGRETSTYLSSMSQLDDELNVVAGSLVRFNDAANKSRKALLEESRQRIENRRQTLQSKRSDFQSYASEVGGSLAAPLVGEGLAGFDLGVAASGNDARRALKALAAAKRKGLDGPLFDLIASSGDLSLIQEFAALSKADIARRERQYGATQSAQTRLGNLAGEEKFDTSLAQIAKELKELRKLSKAVEAGARRGSREGTAGGMKTRDRISNIRTYTGSRSGR